LLAAVEKHQRRSEAKSHYKTGSYRPANPHVSSPFKMPRQHQQTFICLLFECSQ
jgi:hypothetical protein